MPELTLREAKYVEDLTAYDCEYISGFCLRTSRPLMQFVDCVELHSE